MPNTMRRKIYVFGVLLALLLVVPFALAQDGSDVVPPRVIDTTPLPGEELALDSPVSFIFDRPMNTDLDELSAEITPALTEDGSFAWSADGRTLEYTPPASGYARDTVYTFSILAESADGLVMAEAYSASWSSIGYLEVSDVIPTDNTTNVQVDTTVTVIFNRPVVPLVTLEQLEDLPTPLTIDPAIEGTGEWLNTSIYLFRPATNFKGGTRYTVTVTEGLAAVDGAVLAEAFNFQFTTERPEVATINVDVFNGNISLNPVFTVNFTQPMDADSLVGITLVDNLGRPVSLERTLSESGRSATVTPAEPLALDTVYEFVVDKEIVTSDSGAPLQNSMARTYVTVPYPRLIRTEPANGSQNADPYGGLRLFFNAPIDQDTLEGRITIDPEPFREYETYYYDYDNRVTLFYDTEPSTTYTVTIAPGIADPYGNTINEETVVTYTTRAYDSDMVLQTPGNIGLYNAYNAQTQLFITHRNIEIVTVDLYRLGLRTLARMTGPNGYSYFYDFVPEPQTKVRSWRIPVEAPLNQWRYELLTISEVGPSGVDNLTCVGAPQPRLRAGANAVVSDDDPAPLRVRSEPNLGGEILTEYAPGVQVRVTGGPVCSDGFWWWEVFNADDNLTGWMAEGNSSLYFLDPVGDVDAVELTELAPLPAGIYFVNIDSPEVPDYNYRYGHHTMIVATHNITLKFSPKQALAWVTDMQTGLPVADMEVRFYDEDFGEVARATTDSDGLARVNIPRLNTLYTSFYAVVEGPEQFGFAVSEFGNSIDPWRFNLSSNFAPDDDTVYLYTDRPIYRPDQPVYFRGVVRAQDDVTYTVMPELRQVLATIYDAESNIVYEEFLDITPFGTFSGQFELDANASLGYYRLVVGLPQGEGYPEEGSLGFSVAEYRAPEFQVTVTPQTNAVSQGETLRVDVESRYFFGAPVSNAKVSYNIVGENYFFNYDGPGRWSFVDFNYDEGPSWYYDSGQEQIAQGEGTTDDQGKFMIELLADLGEKTQSQVYSIEAVITDESDQVVAGRTSVIIHQGAVYIGLSPEKYVSQAGQETAFNVLSVDWDSLPVAGQVVDYRIVRREWSNVQEKDPQGRTVWRWEVEEIEIDSGSITTDDDGLGTIPFTPDQGGAYKIYASAQDVDGNTVNSSAFMWVSGRNYVAWRQQNSNTIDLISDSDSYSVGDTAEVLIASPFQGEVYALVTVERGDLIKTEVIRMDSNSFVYRLPIEENYAPNVYVSVMIIKGLDETSDFTQFRYGMIQLGVDTERLNLNLSVTPDLAEGEFAGPGDEVTLTVNTTDWEGNPVSAEVGVGVTDLAVLSIAPPNSGTLMSHFYGQQGVSVRTSTPLTVSADQITQEIIDTIKGGGGGGGELGIFEVRQDFVDTPLWSPSIVTDENGTAQVTVTLPDNLTTWRIDARGITDGADRPMLVGQSLTDFISTKPILVRPVTPRFMVVGDRLQIGTIVNNNTREEQIVDVLMEGTGFIQTDDTPLRQTVTIPAGGRVRVNWQIEVLDVPFIDVTFAAINADGSLQDASKPPVGLGDERVLPVYRFTVKETVGTAGVIESDEAASLTEVIAFPPRIVDDSQGNLRIKIERSLAGPTLDGLDYLENFPHQCIEQTVSRFLPNVMTMRALTALNQSNPDLEANLQVQVNFGLQRLYSSQHFDGGWGWFPNDESNPLTTAYALIGLVEAKNSGFAVEERVIENGRGFLRRWLLETSGSARVTENYWELNRRAFVLYGMTRAGEPNASMVTVLFDRRELLNLDAKAFLAMSMMAIDPNDPRLETLDSDFVNQVVISATGAHWDDRPDHYNWSTNTRTTSLALMTLIHRNADTALLANVVRWLMVARTAEAWETTQETAWAVMALTDWMVETGELDANYEFNARLNGQVLEFADNTANADNVKTAEELHIAVQDLLLDEANRLVIIKGDGPGNLYYTAHLNAYLAVPEIEAQSRGIIVNRKYYRASDENRTPITSAAVGEEIMVELTIIAPRNLHYVVVEDPIPAGSEAVDPNLLTTSQLGQRPRLERDDPLSRGWGWWWFSRTEFRDEKVVMYSTYLPRGTYTYRYSVRLGLAGEYNVIPTTGQEFYFPEVYGRGDGMLFTITPAEPPATEAETPETTTESTN